MPLHQRQALSSFINDVQNGRDIVIQGDGTAVRSYMYAADMAVWLLALLVRGEHGTPHNVGLDEPVSIRDLATAVVEASGKMLNVHILGKAAPENAPNVYLPDLGKVRFSMTLKNARSCFEDRCIMDLNANILMSGD